MILSLERILAFSMEGFFMAGAGLGLLGIRPNTRGLFVFAFVYGFFVFLVRTIYTVLKIPLGTHVFILIGIFILFTVLVFKIKLWISTIAALLSILLLFWAEAIILVPFIIRFNIDMLYFVEGRLGYTLLGILITNILTITAFICCYVMKFTLIDLTKKKTI